LRAAENLNTDVGVADAPVLASVETCTQVVAVVGDSWRVGMAWLHRRVDGHRGRLLMGHSYHPRRLPSQARPGAPVDSPRTTGTDDGISLIPLSPSLGFPTRNPVARASLYLGRRPSVQLRGG